MELRTLMLCIRKLEALNPVEDCDYAHLDPDTGQDECSLRNRGDNCPCDNKLEGLELAIKTLRDVVKAQS
jgi:hypothetical protein